MDTKRWPLILGIGGGGLAAVFAVWWGAQNMQDQAQQPAAETLSAETSSTEDAHFTRLRREMVETQLRSRGIRDESVLQAMSQVPRHEFVAESLRSQAYGDAPERIGHGQTISQPYIVALMTELARPRADSRVLDVGTGSGYQAAVLASLCREVYSIEILEPLANEARQRLTQLGYKNVEVRCGDGYRGWPEHAPFDAIVVAAAAAHVPQPLVDQLAVGGRLIIPVGEDAQELIVIEKQSPSTIRRWTVAPVAFVPMTGEARGERPAGK